MLLSGVFFAGKVSRLSAVTSTLSEDGSTRTYRVEGQVFFASAPLSILLGLSVFALSLGVLGTVFIDRYRRLAEVFAQGVGGGAGG